ncbi:MAG: radical SAM protein [Arcobacteraceae bacterium]|jgi:MoaA/NifB/PqqE/SkfB family radical SAM enzyme|nr:radical SAM protein [Arcobacteraceae bacterium]MDY0364630.1 radical SAM protein [Arcobacteraceae bacterium]
MIYQNSKLIYKNNNTIKSEWIKNHQYDSCIITFEVEGIYKNIDVIISNESNIILRNFKIAYKKEKEMIFSINCLSSKEIQITLLIEEEGDNVVSEPTFNFYNNNSTNDSRGYIPKILKKNTLQDKWNHITYDKYKLRRLWVEITSRCNLKCLSCEKHYGIGGPYLDMDMEIFEKIANLAFDELEELSLTGIGEPLFHKKSKEIFDILDKYPHLQLDFVSNGELWNEYWIDRVSRFNSNVAISIDGPTEESHMYNRGKHSKLSHIKWLLEEVKNRRENSDFKLKFSINTLIMKSNMHLLPDMIDFAHEHGVETIVFIMMGNWGQPIEWYEQESPYNLMSKYEAIYEEIVERAKKLNINAIVPPPTIKKPSKIDGIKKYQFCNVPFDSLYIHWDGKISPCCAMRPYVVDSIKDINTKNDIKKTFNSFKQNLLRNEMENKTYNELCLYCDLHYGISKGSPDRSSRTEVITNLLIGNLEKVKDVNQLYIYGGGEICLDLISKIDDYNISGIIDKKAKTNPYKINSFDVKTLDDILLKDNDTIIIASNKFANEIKNDLQTMAVNNNIKLKVVLFNEYIEL